MAFLKQLTALSRGFSRGFASHNGKMAVGDGLGSAPLVELPCAPYLLTRRTRTFTSAVLQQDEGASDAVIDDDQPNNITFDATSEELDQSELKLPTDINLIQKLNPELAEAMAAHAEYARKDASGIRDTLNDLLLELTLGKGANITKTSLSRLRIDQLRGALDNAGSDTRGNKAALVQRLLDLVQSRDVAVGTSAAAEALGDGIVSRKQLERAALLLARKGLTPADVGISNAALRSSQKDVINEAVEFSHIFSDPHEVAQLLVAARADDIAVIDVRGHCTFTDHMVLASGRSSQLVHMMAAGVLHELKRRCGEVAPGVEPGIEGADDPNPEWLVVDAGSVVVHVFAEHARKKFDLEGLWGRGDNIVRVAPKKTMQTLDSMQ